MTLTTGIIYYLMARTDKINGLLETMENSTNLLLIPIALIVIAFVCRWHTAFVESQIMASNERLMVIIEELQSDLDTAKNDLTIAEAAIEELKPVTLDPYIANQKLESQLKEQDRTISNLEDQIDGRDAALRGSAKIIQGLNQEIERLQEASKSVQPIAHSSAERIDQLREVIDQNNKAFAQENERLLAVIEERYNKIDILEDNLDRSDSDRLSELTSIMRMVQALESIPMLDRLSGAIHLIKRVIYDAICKLDPSQAVDP